MGFPFLEKAEICIKVESEGRIERKRERERVQEAEISILQ